MISIENFIYIGLIFLCFYFLVNLIKVIIDYLGSLVDYSVGVMNIKLEEMVSEGDESEEDTNCIGFQYDPSEDNEESEDED